MRTADLKSCPDSSRQADTSAPSVLTEIVNLMGVPGTTAPNGSLQDRSLLSYATRMFSKLKTSIAYLLGEKDSPS